MLRRRRRLCAALCFVGVLFAVDVAPVSAVGYYNLPGSFCQCFGYGNGAGHHACLVLGPSTPWGCCAPNEVRLPCPPRPSYDGYGCGNCGCSGGDPSLIEPSALPFNGPQFAPSPAAMRPQILR